MGVSPDPLYIFGFSMKSTIQLYPLMISRNHPIFASRPGDEPERLLQRHHQRLGSARVPSVAHGGQELWGCLEYRGKSMKKYRMGPPR